MLPNSFQSCSRAENLQIASFNVERRNLEDQIHQLESTNASLKRNYEEELYEYEALKFNLGETLEKLDNLQSNFDEKEVHLKSLNCTKKQLEVKHEKSCSELSRLKDEVGELSKDLNQARLCIKTLKKEAKESNSNHQKVVKRNEDTIENLKEYKSQKMSEEKDFKLKEKKLNKRIKTLDEREAQYKLIKDDEKKEVLEKVVTNNNNETVEDKSISFPAVNFREVITMASYNYANNISTFPSIVSHWIPPPPFTSSVLVPSLEVESSSTEIETIFGGTIVRENRTRVWKCDSCDQTYPGGYTMDQALHMDEHRKKTIDGK